MHIMFLAIIFGYKDAYIYCNMDYDLSVKAISDDGGRVLIQYGMDNCKDILEDGGTIATSLITITSCSWTNEFTIPFKQGLNHLILIYQEGTGDDYAYLNTQLSSQSFVDWMYAKKYNI